MPFCTVLPLIILRYIMFAIVDIAGFQEKVEKGMKLRVPRLEAQEGDTVTFDKVLLVAASDTSVTLGKPYVAGAAVKANVTTHGKGDKIRVFKFKRRKRYQRTQGHRQQYTDIVVTDIAA